MFEGRHEEAVRLADQDRLYFGQKGWRYAALQALEQQVRGLLALRAYDSAEELLEKGVRIASKNGYISMLWRLWDSRMHLRQILQDEPGQHEAFLAAKALIDYLVVSMPSLELTDAFYRDPRARRYAV